MLNAYNNVFIDQKQNGIIEEVMTPGKLGEIHYIQHEPVIWDDKTITKIGIAFDASAKDNGRSLNGLL